MLGAGPGPAHFDIFGDTPSVAVRMASCAPFRCTVVSAAVEALLSPALAVGGGVAQYGLVRKGKTNLKRVSQPMEFYVLSPSSSRSSGGGAGRSSAVGMPTEGSPAASPRATAAAAVSEELSALVLASAAFEPPAAASTLAELAFLRPREDTVGRALDRVSREYNAPACSLTKREHHYHTHGTRATTSAVIFAAIYRRRAEFYMGAWTEPVRGLEMLLPAPASGRHSCWAS